MVEWASWPEEAKRRVTVGMDSGLDAAEDAMGSSSPSQDLW